MVDERRILEILDAREFRVQIIEDSIARSKGCVVVLRCNYPGIDKNNPASKKVVEEVSKELEKVLGVVEKKNIDGAEGLVYIYSVDGEAFSIKKNMIEIEKSHRYGRLVDVDVYNTDGKGISRRDVDELPRSCYLCNDEAHRCVRSRKHSIEEVIKYIEDIVWEKVDD